MKNTPRPCADFSGPPGFGHKKPLKFWAPWAGEWLRKAGHRGEKIHFVVCSDTPQDPALWASLPSSVSLRPVALDYSLMTAADFCLAPPSSLSEMSCWVGGVPRILLTDASSPLPEIAYSQGLA